MRWVHSTIICLLAVATLIFALENMEVVSVDFLWLSVRLPLALLVVVAYIIGMALGSSFWALIRQLAKWAGLKAYSSSCWVDLFRRRDSVAPFEDFFVEALQAAIAGDIRGVTVSLSTRSFALSVWAIAEEMPQMRRLARRRGRRPARPL
jgi:lipopolysaccharide assembly protein A